MKDAKPSLMKTALAVLVLVLAAVVAVRMVVGVLSAVFWIVAVVALIVGAIWATRTLRSAGQGRRERRVKPASGAQVRAAPAETDIDAQLRRMQQELHDRKR
jgi:hypothetical protein